MIQQIAEHLWVVLHDGTLWSSYELALSYARGLLN